MTKEQYSEFQSFHINQFPVHLCSTEKYKTNQIALYIRQPIEEENHTKVSLIPSVLRRGTVEYPTSQKIRQALDQLYGASLYSDVMKRGEEQVIVFRLEVPNEKYLSDRTPLFEKAMQLLSQILFHPLLENGTFSEKYVELEKDLLKRKLSQIIDDKIRYANKRCTEEMFSEERFRLNASGSEEQIPHITSKDLYEYYQKMLASHPMELFVVGDLAKDEVEGVVRKHFSFKNRTELIKMPETKVQVEVKKEKVIIEKTKIQQGKLHIGCRTNTSFQSDDYIPLVVCNGVFGGYAHSKLFRNVREKESLAYYVSSSIESHKGFMMIMSGVEPTNYEKTVKIIKDQLNEMVQGNISEEEIAQTKAIIINQMKESNDLPVQLMERYFHGIVGGVKRKTEEVIAQIEAVTKEQIQRVAQKIEIDTIYFLTSNNDLPEEEGKKI